MIRAEIIAIGTELLGAARLDTNSLLISAHLNHLGIRTARKSVIGDEAEEIRRALRLALQNSEIVILIGGLGPTQDDMTREVVAEALSRPLQVHPETLARIEERFLRLGLELSDNNRRQAWVPEGAEVLENPNGTAPGLFLQEGSTLIFLLPGPPRELEPMISRQVVPRIRLHKPTAPAIQGLLKIASLPESRVDTLIAPIYSLYPEVATTILSSPGIIEVHLQWRGQASEQAEQRVAELKARIREQLGEEAFTEREQTLEEVVAELLVARGRTLATAESCTGGLLGELLTRIPGSSNFYLGGAICYSNPAKVLWAGVNETTLERFGAVSPEAAAQLASGIRRRAAADFGVSITGIAGPGGGTLEKPIGLVYIGLADAEQVISRRFLFSGDRQTIRLRSARAALDLLRRRLG